MSLEWSKEVPLLLALWRFATLLHGQSALEVLYRTAATLAGRPESLERERAFAFFVKRIRRGPPPGKVLQGSSPLPEGIALLRELPEPDRSLLGLTVCTNFSLDQIAHTLGLHVKDATRFLEQTVEQLPEIEDTEAAGAGGVSIESKVAREGGKQESEGVEKKPSLSKIERLRAEMEFLQPTAVQVSRLEEIAAMLERRASSWVPSLRDPGFLGVLAAGVLLLGIGFWLFSQGGRGVEGEAKLKRLLESAAQAEATEYEPVSTPLHQMDDWLALQGLEGFWLPEALQNSQALAVRIFTFEGTRVAAVLLPEQQMLVCFFDPNPLGILLPEQETWNYFSLGNNTAAAAIKGRLCIVAAIRGTQAELERILQIKNSKS